MDDGGCSADDEAEYNVQSNQADAHWRLSLTDLCSFKSAGADGKGGDNHRQRRIIR